MNLKTQESTNCHDMENQPGRNTVPQPSESNGYSFSPAKMSRTESADAVDDREPLALASSHNQKKKRHNWTQEEDRILMDIIDKTPACSETGLPIWPDISRKYNQYEGTEYRTGKQCRERWVNSLRPGVKKGEWTAEEEKKIALLHDTFGPKWSCISKLIKNRSDNDIKNKWYSMMRTKKTQEANSKLETKISLYQTAVVSGQSNPSDQATDSTSGQLQSKTTKS